MEQGVEGGVAGPEIIEADLDALGAQLVQGCQRIGILPRQLPLVEFKNQIAGCDPFLFDDPHQSHDVVMVDQMLARQIDGDLELALPGDWQPVLQLLTGVAQDLVIQLQNQAALLCQRNKVERILQDAVRSGGYPAAGSPVGNRGRYAPPAGLWPASLPANSSSG